jgi:hypothetical protein
LASCATHHALFWHFRWSRWLLVAAALVRHKFPNLNGPQLKQVLIRSADDLGDPGPDAVYGAGKLNVISALSPIDGLTR